MKHLQTYEFGTPLKVVRRVRVHNSRAMEQFLHHRFAKHRAPVQKKYNGEISRECYTLKWSTMNRVLRYLDEKTLKQKYDKYIAKQITL
jgi:hypothetical protein